MAGCGISPDLDFEVRFHLDFDVVFYVSFDVPL